MSSKIRRWSQVLDRVPAGVGQTSCLALLAAEILLFANGCATATKVGSFAPRKGDEIVVAGKYVHTDTPIVLWSDWACPGP